MPDIVSSRTDTWIDEVADHTDIDDKKEDDQPIPSESTYDDKKNCDKHRKDKMFETDDILHSGRVFHKTYYTIVLMVIYTSK